MIYRLLHFLVGYLRFDVQGEKTHKILNVLLREHIRFYRVRTQENGNLSFFTSVQNKRRTCDALNTFCRGEETMFSCVEKGVFPWLYRYRMRVGMFLGIALGIFFVILSTFYVWGVTIETNTAKFSQKELYGFLASIGVKPGAKISDVTDKNLALKFQIEHPEFVFVSFNVTGTHLNAELMERIEPPERTTGAVTTNLTASRGGIIRLVEAQNGEPMVRAGDVVDEGDLLVSGAITLRAGGYRLVQSQGVVLAETYREFECFVPFHQEAEVFTGKEVQHRFCSVLGVNLLPFGKQNPFETFATVAETHMLELFGAPLPFSIQTLTHSEVLTETVEISEKRAKELCMDEFRLFLNSVLGERGELLQEEYHFEQTDDGVRLSVSFACVENIATQTPFSFRPMDENETETGES